MQICEKCGITIRGNKMVCPLCQGPLSGEGGPGPFPVLKKSGMSRFTMIKLVTFLSVLAAMAFLIVLFLLGPSHRWVILTLIGIGVGWADFMIALTTRTNLFLMLSVQIDFAMAACIVIDYLAHFHGWSLAWVLPACFAGLVVLITAIGKGGKYRLEEYIVYLGVALVLSFLQIIPLAFGINPFIWPALASMVFLLALGIAALFFRFRDIRNASEKIFHL